MSTACPSRLRLLKCYSALGKPIYKIRKHCASYLNRLDAPKSYIAHVSYIFVSLLVEIFLMLFDKFNIIDLTYLSRLEYI